MNLQRIAVVYHANPSGILEEKLVTYRDDNQVDRTYATKTLQNDAVLADMTEIAVSDIQTLISTAETQITEENGL